MGLEGFMCFEASLPGLRNSGGLGGGGGGADPPLRNSGGLGGGGGAQTPHLQTQSSHHWFGKDIHML